MNSYRKAIRKEAEKAGKSSKLVSAVELQTFQEVDPVPDERKHPPGLEIAKHFLSSSGFTLMGLAKVTERRICSHCKKETLVSAGVLLRLRNPRGGSVLVNPKVNVFDLDLPRESVSVTIPINACEECFKLQPQKAKRTTEPTHSLVGQALSKKQLAELRIKINEDAMMRSNFYKAPGRPKKEKPEPKKLEDMF